MSAKHTILVVHEDDSTRHNLQQVLLADGYHVVQASSAETGVTLAETNELPNLVIIQDSPDGLEACQRLAALPGGGHIPILIVTEQDNDSHLEKIFACGVTDYLLMPVRPVVLRQRVRRYLKMHEVQVNLSINQETLDLALEAGAIGIWEWDIQTDRVYCSPIWLQNYGYETGDLESTWAAWQSLIHPDDVNYLMEALNEHLDYDVPYEIENRIHTRDGDYRWILTRGRVIKRSSDKKPLLMAGTHRDIHETRMMQAALRESEERHRLISSTISDYAYSYIVLEDGTLKKDWSTQAFHDITGYTFQEMDADGWTQLVHPDDTKLAQKRFERLLAGEVDVTEFRIITKSGEIRWLSDHGYPVYDARLGRVVRIYGAAQDITERKHAEDMLRQQAHELATRNEELDAFAYTVAHDLKNPIASMMGFASLMQTYYDRMTEDKVREYLSLILEGGYKLREIINALLMLAGVSKMANPEITPLDMHALVEDVKRRLKPMIEETAAVIQSPEDPESWPVAAGYGPWVEEVWMNYVSNAMKYGGTPPCIELGADAPEHGMVRFWVRDNGRGLTEDEQRRVFTPFTRLNQVKIEGHGLGLSVVQRIVHKLGGEIGVTSTVGKGSEFSFTLPHIEQMP